ncbi:MAG TPA: DUF4215 domain-containing protein [Enhygromyxa sp.]|nr:DUF4215 domain-containing protein [Enhygromyxa sp.]
MVRRTALSLSLPFLILACTTPAADEESTTYDAAGDETEVGNEEEEEGEEGPGECGDGSVDSDEECDLGSENSPTGVCTPECTIAECGDGLVYEGFEECDDGNAINTDDCVLGCKLASCGDAYLHEGVETCDDGNDDPADGCNSMCLPGACGDGVIQDGEQCDDGNDVTSDDCPACQLAFCGDGHVQLGLEQCDDGNQLDNDGCLPTFCTPAECGDGFVYEGVEECDDGNTMANDACTDVCTTAFCGDGVKQQGVEECDDGNDVDQDFCTNDCISLLYWVEGPQLDVPEDMLGGWEECFTDNYGSYSVGLTNTILGMQCTGSKLLIGCRPVNSTTFTLLAMGERADVTHNLGQQAFSTHEANGVGWYYSTDWSWGFVLGGDPVNRNSCDVEEVNSQYRMCWHTGGDAINEGYRCGNQYPWMDYERVIMHAD